MKAINIIGICLAVILFPVCVYYIDATSTARWASWDWYGGYSSYYGPSAADVTLEAAGISILFVGFFIYQSILNMTKIKTTTSKVMSIIAVCLMGIAFLVNLMMMASDGGATYDEGGAIHVFVSLIMIAFSIVFLVQTVNFGKKAVVSNNEIIDDEGLEDIV